MAGLFAILTAVFQAQWRNLRRLNSVGGNNFFVVVVLFMPDSGRFLQLLLGLVALFPLCADPLDLVPKDRLGLWPLTRRQHALLRLASFLMSPVTWITIGLLAVFKTLSLGLWLIAFAATVQTGRAWLPQINFSNATLPLLPAFGVLGLLKKSLRELFSIFDTYVAMLLSLAALAYRLSGAVLEPDALMGVSLMTALALSTFAQNLFGLDVGALDRYKLWPVAPWKILAAKGAAYLMVLLLLNLWLDPLVALTAALSSLAVGQTRAMEFPVRLTKWQFTSGALSAGIFQLIAMFGLGAGVRRGGSWISLIAIALYAATLLWSARQMDIDSKRE